MQNTNEAKPTVVITGCSGLIGSRLIAALHDKYQVVGLDIEEPREMPAGVEWLRCDLTDEDNVKETVSTVCKQAEGPIASVVHLAAYYDFSGEPSPLYRELTVEGTRRLLQALRACNDQKPVEQFIFSSSLLVMKSATEQDQTIDEESDVDPEWEYPLSKVQAETVIVQEQGQIPAVVLRVAGVFDEDCHSLPISQQIRRIYEKDVESHFFPGDQSRGQPFIHLDDLTDCFVKTIEKRGELEPHEKFLVAEESLMSYGELQDEIGRLVHGKSWTTLPVPKVAAKAGAWLKEQMSGDEEDPFIKPWMVDLADQHYPVDLSRARQHLGWSPRHSLRETLPKMIERLKQDPQRWYEENGLPLPDEQI